MRTKIIFTIILLAGITGATAQENYRQLMESIVNRSLSMKAARETFTADSLGLRRGLNPEDPTASVDFFLGSGASFEMKVEQSFDFPTVYRHRNKIGKLGIARAGQQLDGRVRELLMEASDLYLSMAYNGAVVELLTRRTETIDSILKLTDIAVEKGDRTILDLLQARSMVSEARGLLVMAKSEYKQAEAALRELNGGQPVKIKPGAYPDFAFSGSQEDFVEAAMAGDYNMESARTDSLIAARTLRLSRNEWLPQLVVGYRLDMDQGHPRSAIATGISIPLWQNRGNVKHAKAQISAANTRKADIESRLRVTFGNLYTQYQSASEALSAFDRSEQDYPELLSRSAAAGSITSIAHLISLVDWYEVEQVRQEVEYKLAQSSALMIIYLMD